MINAAVQLYKRLLESRLMPAGLLQTEHNANVIGNEFISYISATRTVPTDEQAVSIVRQLGSLDSGGQLQYHATAAATPAAETRPFPEEKRLAFLQSVDDLNEIGNDVLRRFLDGAAFQKQIVSGRPEKYSLTDKFNARAQWLKKNNVRRPEVRKAGNETPQVRKSPERIKFEQGLAAIRAKIDALSPSWRQSVQRVNARLHREVNRRLDEGDTIASVDRYVAQEISDFETGAIR